MFPLHFNLINLLVCLCVPAWIETYLTTDRCQIELGVQSYADASRVRFYYLKIYN
ncbi:hypothetical protein KC19_1G069300 [Ceratodon purpureus]|uniref:Uncharacterized protein n=1 Tax=Ceratodon purpureus TaxID=3225 RepID=A0A8T0J5K3_CERPU|nr:hypothetical protein KC19_1G069300 [Ceratodon purpureus]